MSTTDPLNPEELTRGKTLDEFCVGPTHEVAAIGGSLAAPPTASPEAVGRLRLPQNVACGFAALRSSTVDLQHWSFRCYLFKFRFHGRLIFSLHRRPCLPLNRAHVAQEQFTCR